MKRNVQNTKFQTPKTNKGITLVALVITIIVLLILAGVAINMAINSDGLFEKANEASEKWNTAVAEETDAIEDLLAEMGVINWEKAMKEAVAPTSQDEERNSGVIGIGTDGKPVDMDLWEYTLLEDGTYGLNNEAALEGKAIDRTAGYIASYTVEENGTQVTHSNYNADGTIKGTVPTYISTDGGKTYKEVTNMTHTFSGSNELVIAPEIPHTVKDMSVTFYQASNLVTPPAKIPDSVENMGNTFSSCAKLTEAPQIGNNVKNMTATFSNCSSLKEMPLIPNSVTNMNRTFMNCILLVNVTQQIPNSVINMQSTFEGCVNLKQAPEILNGVENMQAIFSGCTKLKKGPTHIPSSVINLVQAFNYCVSLEGTIKMDANIDETILFESNGVQFTGYKGTFNNACTNGTGLTILKTSTCPREILGKMVNNNAKITIEE